MFNTRLLIPSLVLLVFAPVSRADEASAAKALRDLGAVVSPNPDKRGDTKLSRVIIQDRPVTDAQLAALKELPNLDYLQLYSCSKLTNDAMKTVAACKGIRVLDIRSTNVNDAGLAELTKLPELRNLQMGGNSRNLGGVGAITTRGLAELKNCKKLEVVHVDLNYDLNDLGLAEIAKIPTLTDLFLKDTKITDKGTALFKSMPKLKSLGLVFNEQLSDASAVSIGAVKTLELLQLDGTPFTDRALSEFAKLSNLKEFYMYGSMTTKAGRGGLRRALPKCMFDDSFGN